MTETFNVFILINIKCYVVRSSQLTTKLKIICKNLFTKMSKFFNLLITRLIQFHDWLFIDPRISWWSETQTILTCTCHWPACNSAKLNLYQFPLCRVALQLDLVILSSNFFPSCTIQNNCGNFFNLDSRFSKRRQVDAYSCLHGGGSPHVSEMTRLGRVTHLSII